MLARQTLEAALEGVLPVDHRVAGLRPPMSSRSAGTHPSTASTTCRVICGIVLEWSRVCLQYGGEIVAAEHAAQGLPPTVDDAELAGTVDTIVCGALGPPMPERRRISSTPIDDPAPKPVRYQLWRGRRPPRRDGDREQGP